MTQVEKRILELEFDNKNFEANVKSTVDSLEDLEKHLEMKDAGKGFEEAEKAASNVKFKGIRDALNSVAEKFSSFRQTAARDINDVEAAGSKFSLKGMLSTIGSVATAFLSMGRSSKAEISDVQRAEQNFSMREMASAVQEVSDRFSALGIVGITILQDLTHAALNAGKSLASNILDPIVQGGKKRAFALENARFTLQGLIKDSDGGAEQINAIMQAASDSVSGTAYALDDAASAAAQFAATGLRAGKDNRELESALAGIAGTAATVNAEYSDIAHIFTTVAGNGRLMTEQLNQFSYRGMNAAATLKDAYNAVLNGTSTLAPEIQEQIRQTVQFGMESINEFSGSLEGITEGDLRKLVSEGKISFDIFSAIMSDTFGDHAKDANKTFNGSMANIRAALARTGAMFYSDLIVQEGPLVNFFNHIRESVNSFNKALKPFASLVTGAINSTITYVNTFLEKLEGLHVLDLLSVPLESFTKALKFIGAAFQEVFPALSEADFRSMAVDLAAFLRSLKLSNEQLITIKTIATGVASGFKILGNVISALMHLATGLVHAFQPAIDLFVELMVMAANVVTEFSKFIDESNILDNAVNVVTSTVGSLVSDLVNFARALGGVFMSVTGSIDETVRASDLLGMVGNKISELFHAVSDNGGLAMSILNGFGEVVNKIAEDLGPLLDKLGELGQRLGSKFFETVSQGIDSITFDNVAHFIELIISGALALSIKKAFDSITGVIETAKEFVGNLGTKLKEAGAGFTEFFDSIVHGQQTVAPLQITKIAAAIALLAGALFLVSSLKPQELAAGTAALGAAMIELGLFVKALQAVMASSDVRAIAGVSTYILALAAAMLILATAIKKLGTLNYTEIVRGLVGLGTSMVIFTKTVTAMSNNVKPTALNATAGSIMTLAAAMVVLSLAFKVFSTIDLEGIGKGLVSVGGSLAIFVAFSKTVKPYSLTACASAIRTLGTAMVVLAAAFKIIETISWEGIAKGLSTMAGALLTFVAYSKLVKPGPIAQTAGSLVTLSVAIAALGGALKIIETISWEGIGKGLTVLGASMAAFVAYSKLVNPAAIAETSVGLIAFGAALILIAQSFNMMSNVSFESMAQSLLVFLGVLAGFVAASSMLSKSIGGMLSLLVIPTVVVPLAAALMMLSTIPFTGLVAGIAAIAAVIAVFAIAAKLLTGSIPAMLGLSAAMLAFGVAVGVAGAGIGIAASGLAVFAAAIAASGMAIIGVVMELARNFPILIGYIIDALNVFLTKTIEIMPQIAAFVAAGLQMLVTVFLQNLPIIMQAIGEFFLQFIQMVTTYIPQIVEMFLQFFLQLLQQFVTYIPQIADAVLQLITAILQAVADHIQDIVAAALSVAEGFIRGIADGIGGVVDAAFQLVISFINGLADAIRANHGALFDAIGNLISAIVEAIIDGISQLVQAAGELMKGFFDGLMEGDPLGKIGEFAMNLIKGFAEGVINMIGEAVDAVGQLGQAVLDELAKVLGIASPSRKARELGEYTGEGFIDGLDDKQGDAKKASGDFVDTLLGAFGTSKDKAIKMGDKLTGGLLTGLSKEASKFGDVANKEIGNFIDGVMGMFGVATDTGNQLSANTVKGLGFNFNEYGNLGTSEGNSYIGGVRNTAGAAMTAGLTVTREAVRGLGFNFNEYGQTGTSEGNSFVSAVAGRAESAMQAGLRVTANAVNGLRLNANDYQSTGSSHGVNFAGGVSSKNGAAYDAGWNLADHGRSGTGDVSFTQSGRYAAEGFIDGIDAKLDAVWRAGVRMAREALDAVKRTIDEGSPSKEFAKSGRWSALGFAKGMIDNTKYVVEASSDMGLASMDALNDTLQAASFVIEYGDFESQPTITPIVDLANVDAATSQIDRLFAQSGAVANLTVRAQSAAFGYDAATAPAPVAAPAPTIINQKMEQNNYSPKALDGLEIYRRTKSLFATAQGNSVFVDGGVTYAQ